jgi:pSer/pThr/pTyr-binding forkhead associated (FHA) protein
VPGETRNLNLDGQNEALASQEIKAIDRGMPRPWRVALRILQKENRVIFDMDRPMVLGRMDPDVDVFPDIDLGPYEADELGVSREHLVLKLDGDRIVVSDNGSSNGTLINQERMKPREDYPVRDGDEIQLGLMKVKIELLMNPFTSF